LAGRLFLFAAFGGGGAVISRFTFGFEGFALAVDTVATGGAFGRFLGSFVFFRGCVGSRFLGGHGEYRIQLDFYEKKHRQIWRIPN